MSDVPQATNEAVRLRLKTIGEDGPTVPPIDVVDIANRLGIKVEITSGLKNNIDGFILKKKNEDIPTIYVNKNRSSVRQRFTIAHELGHYWKNHVIDKNSEYGYVDFRNELSSKGTNDTERWANSFAAELLMPAKFLYLVWASNWSIYKIKSTLDVSDAALGNRLTNLGLLKI